MNSKRVCVIGAGPSGITAIKNIADQNIELVAYDYNSDVGEIGFIMKMKVTPVFLKQLIL